jgi:hypothetical protein
MSDKIIEIIGDLLLTAPDARGAREIGILIRDIEAY